MPTTTKRKSRKMPIPEKDRLEHYSGRTGAEIRARRKRKNWTRAELAESVTKGGYDLSEAALQSYENGNRPIPLNALPYFASALGISIKTLLPDQ